jgi:hypothetical protein
MFSAEDYLQGWIAYSFGACCLLLFLWLVLRKSAWHSLRHLALLVSAAILLTPVTAYRDDSHLAPAFFVSLYEGVMLSGADAGFQRGLAPIIAVAIFALFFYGLVRVVWGLLSKRAGKRETNKEANKGSGRKNSANNKRTKKLRGAQLNVAEEVAD